MHRRAFVLFVGSITHRLRAAPTAPLSWASSFRLSILPNEFVQHVLVKEEGLYYVTFASSTASSSLGCATFEGVERFHWQLPSGTFYFGLGIRKSHSFVLPCENRGVGMGIREFDQSGIHLRALDIKNGLGILGYCVVGDLLAMLRVNGSLEILDLATGDIRRLPIIGLDPQAAVMYAVSDTAMFIVDRANAQFCKVDLSKGSTRMISIEGPEISNSKNFFAAKVQGTKSTAGPRASNLLMIPSAPDSSGGFYAVLMPISRAEGALVLRISGDGSISRKFYIKLPDAVAQSQLPAQLVAHDTALFTLFSTGDVLVYSI
ncbi:MAG: hypothetical protein JWO48_1172 [Bryobacterales bacterium]|nr:hypothetical protein [Bryobacterales bacterium]